MTNPPLWKASVALTKAESADICAALELGSEPQAVLIVEEPFADGAVVEALDLIGSLIGKLTVYLDRQPINMPSGMLPLSDEYFRRIEAVEFTVKSDDGKEPRNFKKADLVLVGVSRTSKTPLSTLLAQRGLKVANLPLVLGVPTPPELEEANQDRVVGLTIGLGPLAVSPLDMAAAYATFAAMGIYAKPMAITKVILPGGKVDTDSGWGKPQAKRAVSEGVAWKVNDVLGQNALYGTGAGSGDGIHPNAAGQPQILENLWPRLKPLLVAPGKTKG